MMRFPVRYAHANVLLGPGGQAAALYRLGMSSYPFLATAGKWALQRRLERLAHTIGADFSLWRVSRAYPASSYVEHTLGLLDDRHQDPEVWRTFLEGHSERLHALGSHVPECYLAVSLEQRVPAGFGAGLLPASDRVRSRIEDLARVGSKAPIPAARLRGLTASEQRLYERLSSVVALRRARTVELQWLLRRTAGRGIGEPDLDEHWQPQALEIHAGAGKVAYEPLGEILWRCANCAISEHERTLWIDGEGAAPTRRCSRSARWVTPRSSPGRAPSCCSPPWSVSGSPSMLCCTRERDAARGDLQRLRRDDHLRQGKRTPQPRRNNHSRAGPRQQKRPPQVSGRGCLS